MLSPLATALVGFTVLVAFSPLLAVLFGPAIIQIIGEFVGNRLRKRSKNKRQAILSNAIADDEDLYVRGVLNKTETEGKISVESDEDWEQVDNLLGNEAEVKEGKKDGDWEGVVGFFHPFCNAGGGGERVLWAAIRATQTRWPKAVCVVYTGDHEVQKEATLERVEVRFPLPIPQPLSVPIHLLICSTNANYPSVPIQHPPPPSHGHIPLPHNSAINPRNHLPSFHPPRPIPRLPPRRLGCIHPPRPRHHDRHNGVRFRARLFQTPLPKCSHWRLRALPHYIYRHA